MGQCSWMNTTPPYAPQPTSGNVTCSGAITVTYTWHANDSTDLPPDCVIIGETCMAAYNSTFIPPTPQGQCDNGLEATSTPYNSSNAISDSKSSARYQVKQNPGQSFTITCNPTASLSGQGASSPGGHSTGGAYVHYRAIVYPARVTLTGVTPVNNTDNILIGQGCSANLVTTAPVMFQNYHWGTNNSSTFASFDRAPDDSWGHVTYCDPAIWTSANPSWFWFMEGDGTVTGSADAYVSGQCIGSVAAHKALTVWTPYSKFIGIPGPINYTANQASVIAGDSTRSGNDPGMKFIGSVGTPYMFTTNGTGQWCFLQILDLDRVQHGFPSPIGIATHVNEALDKVFPYAGFFSADSTSGTHTENDTDDSPESKFISLVQSFSIHDTYKMYMLYDPPYAVGNELGKIEIVPIQSLIWHWNTVGNRPPNQLFSPSPPEGNIISDGSTPEHQHPRWTNKFEGSD